MTNKNKEQHKEIGAYISKCRIHAGVTQKEFATKLGISQSNVSKLEQGKLHLEFIMALNIAKCLEIPFSDFMTDIDKILESKEGA